ncbi:MAG: hypothetical protein IID06_06170 [Gemmatimonadetes bacterium]|nr:hypothetical protein [Gemmatimonadota bacterium]
MKRGILSPLLSAAVVGGVILGCEPGSVTEAREQLGRGALDTIGFVIPLVNDTFFVSQFLNEADMVSTPDGLLSLRVQNEDVAFGFTDVLQSEEVTTTVVLPSPARTPGMQAPGDQRDTLRFTTPAGSNVVGATVLSGWIVRSITNGTTCDATSSLLVRDSLGGTIVTFLPADVFVAAAATVVDSVNANGATFIGFAEVIPSVSFGGGCVPGSGSQVSTDVTFRLMTLASVDLESLSESFSVEEAEELIRSDLNFDELEDAIDQSTLNSATIALTVVNSADLPLVLDSMTLGAVRLDAGGQLMRDGGGNLIFETDAGGNPILITIADPGQTRLAVPRAQGTTPGTVSVSVQAAPLVDRITHILLADERVAFVASGTAEASDGLSGRAVLGDSVIVNYDVVVGLDFTIPLTGIEFEVDNKVSAGVGLDFAEVEDMVDRIVSVGGVARVENFTAFGVEVVAVFAPGSVADSNVFVQLVQLGGFALDTIVVSGPAVDANGVPTGSTTDSVAVSITSQEVRVLLGDSLTAGVRIRLLPGTGGGGRGVIRPNDMIVVSAGLTILVRRGGQ